MSVKSLLLIIGFIVGLMVLVEISSTKHERHTPTPNVIMDVRDESLEQFSAAWATEIGRRFPNSVGVLCHGGDAVHGEWLCKSESGRKAFGHLITIEQLISIEQARYPGRTIVLLSCNVEHDLLTGHPGVYYSPSSVWCVPDRAVIDKPEPTNRATLDGRSLREPEVVGNIFEFLSAE